MNWKLGILALAALGFAAGCSGLGADRNAPLPTVVLDSGGGGETTSVAPQPAIGSEVVASGNIASANEVKLSPAGGGILMELLVKEGDAVQAGQVLARLGGSERLTAALESARLELLSAQQAREALDERLAGDRAAAQLRLANAKQALEDAQKKRTWRQYRNGSDAMVAAGQADLILAKDRLEKAQEAYDSVSAHDDFSVVKAGALSALAAAQRAHDRALANLDYLVAMPDELEVAKVEAELVSAQAEEENARVEAAKLENGPDPKAVALAEARISNAQAALAAAQAALADMEVRAPFDATVAAVMIHPGEWAQPGQPVVVLIDLTHLIIETTDLSERDIAQVAVDQPVRVAVRALNDEVAGRVARISPLADTLGGDVVYKTTIDLEPSDLALLPGMSVDVYFEHSK